MINYHHFHPVTCGCWRAIRIDERADALRFHLRPLRNLRNIPEVRVEHDYGELERKAPLPDWDLVLDVEADDSQHRTYLSVHPDDSEEYQEHEEIMASAQTERGQIRADMDTYVEELRDLIKGSSISARSESRPLVDLWKYFEDFESKINLIEMELYPYPDQLRRGIKLSTIRAWDAYDDGDVEMFADALSVLEQHHAEMVELCRKPLASAWELIEVERTRKLEGRIGDPSSEGNSLTTIGSNLNGTEKLSHWRKRYLNCTGRNGEMNLGRRCRLLPKDFSSVVFKPSLTLDQLMYSNAICDYAQNCVHHRHPLHSLLPQNAENFQNRLLLLNFPSSFHVQLNVLWKHTIWTVPMDAAYVILVGDLCGGSISRRRQCLLIKCNLRLTLAQHPNRVMNRPLYSPLNSSHHPNHFVSLSPNLRRSYGIRLCSFPIS